MMSSNVGDSALLFVIKPTFFFIIPPPYETFEPRLPAQLRSEQRDSSRKAHPRNEVQSPKAVGFAAFWLFKAWSSDGHPCKSSCLPRQLIAQSCELKLLVETREQNLYTNEIICMKCYFNKTA